MEKIKEIYQHNGTDWGDAIPIGTDAEYVDGLDDVIDLSIKNKVDKSGDTMTGSLYFSGANNQYVGLLINNYGENLDCGWDYGNGGAGMALRSPNFGTSSQHGEFDIYARSQADEAYTKHLIGKADGTLSWGGGLIPYGQGAKITPTFNQCTTGSYTACRKIGNLVILSFNINITTATANYDYLTGLPNAVENFAGSSAIGTAAGRWCVTTTGTLRFDGTPTTGWHNGNITYICQ